MSRQDYIIGAEIIVEDYREFRIINSHMSYKEMESYKALHLVFSRGNGNFDSDKFNNYIEKRIW